MAVISYKLVAVQWLPNIVWEEAASSGQTPWEGGTKYRGRNYVMSYRQTCKRCLMMFRMWVRSGAGDQMYLSRVCCNVVSGAEWPSWPSILVITLVFFIRPTLINIRAVTGL